MKKPIRDCNFNDMMFSVNDCSLVTIVCAISAYMEECCGDEYDRECEKHWKRLKKCLNEETLNFIMEIDYDQ